MYSTPEESPALACNEPQSDQPVTVDKTLLIKDFEVFGKDSLDGYIEVSGDSPWLSLLNGHNHRFFAFHEKDQLGNKAYVFRIPFMRLKEFNSDRRYVLPVLVQVNTAMCAALRDWLHGPYQGFIKRAVENDEPFEFSLLPEIIDHLLAKARGVSAANFPAELEPDDECDDDGDYDTSPLNEDSPVIYLKSGEEVPAVGRYLEHHLVRSITGRSFQIKTVNYLWYQGCVRARHRNIHVYEWVGTKKLSELGLKVNPSLDLISALAKQGRRSVELSANPSYVRINIPYMEVKGWMRWHRIPAQGRLMIDQAGMFQSLPDSTEHVVSTWGPDSLLNNDADTDNISTDTWTDVEYAMMSPYLFGFSMVAKQWGRVHVDHVDEIQFRKDAFSRLVMDEEDKSLIHSIVKNIDTTTSGDFIEGKGGGCVFLFHGKPGLGKTLTAEAVAEEVRRPLYAVSVGELGTNVDTLEDNLQRILQLATRWNAVLLLDEADVFLEERTKGDIERNAMVGTFLRLLEYYNGILVLTSNRARSIDPAFYSRVSFAKKYHAHTEDVRTQVINNLLDLNGIEMSPEDIDVLAKIDVNGRQFKNSIRLARFLCTSENRSVGLDDILRIVNRVKKFEQEIMEETADDEHLPSTTRGV